MGPSDIRPSRNGKLYSAIACYSLPYVWETTPPALRTLDDCLRLPTVGFKEALEPGENIGQTMMRCIVTYVDSLSTDLIAMP